MINDGSTCCTSTGYYIYNTRRQIRLPGLSLLTFNAVRGVVSAGFNTTVFPVAIAGAIFQAAINKGKFHGMICPATPSGSVWRLGNAYSNLSAQPA